MNYKLTKTGVFSQVTTWLVLVAFCASMIVLPSQVRAQNEPATILNLPTPGTMVGLTDQYNPAIIRGMTLDPDNPLKFNFLLDPGQTNLTGSTLSAESNKLIHYFLAALTTPEKDMWVNLSPYEANRIVPEEFGVTEMGRDLLAQDYILKQLSASLMNPDDDLGREFWDRVYAKAHEKYGTTEIPTNTFNKIWIVPDKAVVYEHGLSAFVVESHLKVMLEEDYLALNQAVAAETTQYEQHDPHDDQAMSAISAQIVREILIPEIEKEVNQGKTFAQLRQIYTAMILATWYKNNLKEGLLGQIYVDQSKVKGIDLADKDLKEKIYHQYYKSFQKGIINHIREDYDAVKKRTIPRKYFAGGYSTRGADNDLLQTRIAKQKINDFAMLSEQQALSIAANSLLVVSTLLADVGPASAGTARLNEMVATSKYQTIIEISSDPVAQLLEEMRQNTLRINEFLGTSDSAMIAVAESIQELEQRLEDVLTVKKRKVLIKDIFKIDTATSYLNYEIRHNENGKIVARAKQILLQVNPYGKEENVCRGCVGEIEDAYGILEDLDDVRAESKTMLLIGAGRGVSAVEYALRFPKLKIVAVNKEDQLWNDDIVMERMRREGYSAQQVYEARERITVKVFDVEDDQTRAKALGDTKYDFLLFEPRVQIYIGDKIRAIENLYNHSIKVGGIFGFVVNGAYTSGAAFVDSFIDDGTFERHPDPAVEKILSETFYPVADLLKENRVGGNKYRKYRKRSQDNIQIPLQLRRNFRKYTSTNLHLIWSVYDAEELPAADDSAYYRDELPLLTSAIVDQIDDNPVLLIGGDPGAGKSTLTKEIKEYLETVGIDAVILNSDQFFKVNHLLKKQLMLVSLLNTPGLPEFVKMRAFRSLLVDEKKVKQFLSQYAQRTDVLKEDTDELQIYVDGLAPYTIKKRTVLIVDGSLAQMMFGSLGTALKVYMSIDKPMQVRRIYTRGVTQRGYSPVRAGLNAQLLAADAFDRIFAQNKDDFDFVINTDSSDHVVVDMAMIGIPIDQVLDASSISNEDIATTNFKYGWEDPRPSKNKLIRFTQTIANLMPFLTLLRFANDESLPIRIALGYSHGDESLDYAQTIARILTANNIGVDFATEPTEALVMAEATRESKEEDQYFLALHVTASDAEGLAVKLYQDGVITPFDLLMDQIIPASNAINREGEFPYRIYQTFKGITDGLINQISFREQAESKLHSVFDISDLKKKAVSAAQDIQSSKGIDIGSIQAVSETMPGVNGLPVGQLDLNMDDNGRHLGLVTDINGSKMLPVELALVFAHYLSTQGEQGAIVRSHLTSHLLDPLASLIEQEIIVTDIGVRSFLEYPDSILALNGTGHIHFKYKGESFASSPVAEQLLALEIIYNKGMPLSEYLEQIYSAMAGVFENQQFGPAERVKFLLAQVNVLIGQVENAMARKDLGGAEFVMEFAHERILDVMASLDANTMLRADVSRESPELLEQLKMTESLIREFRQDEDMSMLSEKDRIQAEQDYAMSAEEPVQHEIPMPRFFDFEDDTFYKYGLSNKQMTEEKFILYAQSINEALADELWERNLSKSEFNIALGYNDDPQARKYAHLLAKILTAYGLRISLANSSVPSSVIAEASGEINPEPDEYSALFPDDRELQKLFAERKHEIGIYINQSSETGEGQIDIFEDGVVMQVQILNKIDSSLTRIERRSDELVYMSYESLDDIPEELLKRTDFIARSQERLDVFDFDGTVAQMDEFAENLSARGITTSLSSVGGALIPRTDMPVGELDLNMNSNGRHVDDIIDVDGTRIEAAQLALIFGHYLHSQGETGEIVRSEPTSRVLDRLAKKMNVPLRTIYIGTRSFLDYPGAMLAVNSTGHIHFKYKGRVFASSPDAELLLALQIMSEKKMTLSEYLAEIYGELGESHTYEDGIREDSLLEDGSNIVEISFEDFIGRYQTLQADRDRIKQMGGLIIEEMDLGQQGLERGLIDQSQDDTIKFEYFFEDGSMSWVLIRHSTSNKNILRVYAEAFSRDEARLLTFAAKKALRTMIGQPQLAEPTAPAYGVSSDIGSVLEELEGLLGLRSSVYDDLEGGREPQQLGGIIEQIGRAIAGMETDRFKGGRRGIGDTLPSIADILRGEGNSLASILSKSRRELTRIIYKDENELEIEVIQEASTEDVITDIRDDLTDRMEHLEIGATADILINGRVIGDITSMRGGMGANFEADYMRLAAGTIVTIRFPDREISKRSSSAPESLSQMQAVEVQRNTDEILSVRVNEPMSWAYLYDHLTPEIVNKLFSSGYAQEAAILLNGYEPMGVVLRDADRISLRSSYPTDKLLEVGSTVEFLFSRSGLGNPADIDANVELQALLDLNITAGKNDSLITVVSSIFTSLSGLMSMPDLKIGVAVNGQLRALISGDGTMRLSTDSVSVREGDVITFHNLNDGSDMALLGVETVTKDVEMSGNVRSDNNAVGGINLNAELLDLQIRRDAEGVPLPLLKQPINDIQVEGFLPIIINITPASNLPYILGLLNEDVPSLDTSNHPELDLLGEKEQIKFNKNG